MAGEDQDKVKQAPTGYLLKWQGHSDEDNDLADEHDIYKDHVTVYHMD